MAATRDLPERIESGGSPGESGGSPGESGGSTGESDRATHESGGATGESRSPGESDGSTTGPLADAAAVEKVRSRRHAVAAQLSRLVSAIRNGDDNTVEQAVLALSRRNRLLAPLGMVVGAFVMLFQGIRLLFTNWRLTLVQVLPAMWIWAAMFDLKAHVFRGKSFHPLYGFWLIPIILAIAAITAAAFFLNAVFAFAIAAPGSPQIRPAFAEARSRWVPVLGWGFVIGLALGVAAMVTNRWGTRWFGLSMGIVIAVMMVAYVAVPGRLVGITPGGSRRDKLAASAVGGALGALVSSPAYLLGRLGIVLVGSATFRIPAVIMLVIAAVLQTGATSAVKTVKLSARLAVGRANDADIDVDDAVQGSPAGPGADTESPSPGAIRRSPP